MAPFLATVTIGLYGYKANNSIRGYVASGESASEVSLWNQTDLVSRRSQKRAVLEKNSLNRPVISGTQKELQVRSLEGAWTSVIVFAVIVTMCSCNHHSE
jgi:hypothetical protein